MNLVAICRNLLGSPMKTHTTLCAGDWVEVRSKEEILETLDKNGRLDGLPFMPQMFKYCGQRFQVYKRTHKTCDTVGISVSRCLPDGVHLEHRCDGKAYGGCQAGCLIFWKEAWLKPGDGSRSATANHKPSGEVGARSGCTEDDVWRATNHSPTGEQARYFCQATELPNFTAPLKWWDARQYVETYRSGNASLGEILRGFLYLGVLLGHLGERARREGLVRVGEPTPRCDLNLRPGDWVRIKSYEEILATLDKAGSNRGLSFDAELLPYCGKAYRVKTRVEKFINERTGKMQRLRTPAVILEGVYCKSLFAGRRLFCPRSIYSWWREIWLEKVSEAAASHHVSGTKRRSQNTRWLERAQ